MGIILFYLVCNQCQNLQKITSKELPAGTSYIQIKGDKQKTQKEIGNGF